MYQVGRMIAYHPWMKAALLLLLAFLVFTEATAQTKDDKRARQLEAEQKKLEKTKNPQDRAKSFMRIADITLSYASDSANASELPQMRSQIEQYRQAITGARDAMLNSGLDPHKKSGGYRSAEIAIRKQILLLQDISRRLTLEERAPVQDALDAATKIRDEFMRALFG